MPKERILIVDDEINILSLLEIILEGHGFDVTSTESPEKAIELFREEDFDILVTDVNMPGMNGLDLLEKFKKVQPDSAAIIITGEGTVDIVIDAMKRGADSFVKKPFEKKELTDAVSVATKKLRLARENTKLKALIPIFDVSRHLMQKVHVDELLCSVVDIARRESGADSVSIMLKGDDGSLTIDSAVGLEEGFDRGFKLKKGEGLAGSVAMEGKPLLLREDEETEHMKREDLSSALILPLKVEGEVLGVMNLNKLKGNYPLFTNGDCDLMSIIAGQVAVALKNAQLVSDLERLFIGTIGSLAAAVDMKSPWTAGHSGRVTSYANLIGLELGFSEEERKDLSLAGALHDIGKIGTAEKILNKADKLSDEEYAVIKQHPRQGADLLANIRQFGNVIPAVRHHHEMYNGKGYPDGLKGEGIPLIARILAVTDAYDAMKSDRPYRKGLSEDEIVEEFECHAGTQFDPQITKIFLDVISH